MMMRLILWLSIGWLPLLSYFMLRNETKFKKNIVLGVTLPYQAREDQAVQQIIHRFQRQSLVVLVAMTLLIIPGILIRSLRWSYILWGFWLFLALIIPYGPYLLANRELKALKVARGWKRLSEHTLRLNISAIPSQRWLSPGLFLPAVLLNLLPLLWTRSYWPMQLIMLVTTISFWFGYRFLYRNKSEMIDANAELAQVLSQVRRRNWGRVWLMLAYSFGLISIITSLPLRSGLWQLVLILVISFGLTWAAIQVEFNTRRVQEKLTLASGKAWYVDEDDHWIGGIIYYNPHDSRLIINNRIGINSTINLAKRSGKVIAMLTLLLFLSAPLSGIFFAFMETSPIELNLNDTQIEAGSYSIKRLDLSSVELLEKRPADMRRVYGSAFENRLSGKYTAPELGDLQLYLDPNQPPFLLLKTTSGKQYLFGSRDPQKTQAIYQELKKQFE